jgi:hypothetical protein
MDQSSYDVFLSYRRVGSSELAQLLRHRLTQRGLRVFLDVRELGAGKFDEALLERIAETPNFVLLLTPTALDRCRAEGDWLRREIEHALRTDRNIVPVLVQGFDPTSFADLPDSMADLGRYQGVVYDHQFSDESIDRLYRMLRSGRSGGGKRRATLVAVLALAASIIGVWTWRRAATPAAVSPPAVERSAAVAPASSRQLAPLALYWYAFGQRASAGAWEEIVVRDGATMRSGDQFRLVISPSADCFAYVVSLNADGSTSVLFPHAAIGADNRLRAGERYEIPDGLNWFTLDDSTGVETLYLLADYDPVHDLESLLREAAERSAAGERERVAAQLARLERPSPSGELRTADDRIVLRGIEIRPDGRTASATLASGRAIEREMHFAGGDIRVVKRIRIVHE